MASKTADTDNAGGQKNDMATLTLPDGRNFQLSVMKPSIGDEILVDVRHLHAQAKVLTYDPGFNSTASCKSAITYIDGDAGVCLYRGYPVHELIARGVSYPDTCHLLLYGDLPGAVARDSFLKQMRKEMLVHEQLIKFVQTFVSNAHPMSVLSSVISAMASFYADPMTGDHLENPEERELACIRMISKMPSVAAMIYKVLMGQPIVYPRSDLTYAENFLNMMFGTPIEPYKVDPIKAKIIDAFLIIHADHEQNASTSTVRTAGSSLANPYACIAAGVTSLWGRAHGGANEAVIRMLTEIGDESKIDEFMQGVKDKKMRLMGFGHRIYRNHDPRATVMRDLCYQLFASSGMKDPLFDVAMKLEQVALNDDYFVSRKLYPNVDFYSGIVMRGLGIPENMFTVMFALGRTVGWLSHWKEMVEEKQLKISRPRQLYLGRPQLSVEHRHQMPLSSEVVNEKVAIENAEQHHKNYVDKPFSEVQARLMKVRTPRLKAVDFDYDVWGECAPMKPASDFSLV